MKTGIELIKQERERQITKEGWTPAHDDTHDKGELRDAGIAYAMACDNKFMVDDDAINVFPLGWYPQWWKPSDDPIRNLEKAGALIAAEIDRLLRIEERRNEPVEGYGVREK